MAHTADCSAKERTPALKLNAEDYNADKKNEKLSKIDAWHTANRSTKERTQELKFNAAECSYDISKIKNTF